MVDFLTSVLAFVVALSVLIAVHEFGHFWVARSLGVKVLRYSIGFGRRLWSWRSGPDQTEYVIAALPLGGYVKMLDEREGEVAPEEAHRAFNRQPLAKRFAIVSAGPIFNLLFAVLAYWVMFVHGVPGFKPIVGQVTPGTPAARAGLHPGQEILAVDGAATPTWGAVFDALLPRALRGETTSLEVRGKAGGEQKLKVDLSSLGAELKTGELASRVGVEPYRPPIPPVIDEVVDGSAAQQAGLKPGDRVVAVDGQPIERWEELVDAVRKHPGRSLALKVERSGRTLRISVTPKRVETAQGAVGRLGAAVKVDPSLIDALRAEQQYGPLRAVGEAFAKTWDMSTLTLQMLGEMVIGRASMENISGPITIAVYAKASALAGLSQFMAFLGVVSLSLGVLNLLPIPILDGGHLMFYVVELIKGSPVSERTEAIGQKIGLAIILLLMTLAFYNDLMRLTE
jgi:regulator of sigma E protease